MVAELHIAVGAGPAPGQFEVAVVDSPAGEARALFGLDSGAVLRRHAELQQALLTSVVTTRGKVSTLEAPVREVGEQLFDALFSDPEVCGVLRASTALADQRGEDLRIVLRVEPPELAALPWEAMYDDAQGAYVSRREPLVRHLPVPSVVPPLAVEGTLRVLALAASPRGLPRLDVSRERIKLEEALAGPVGRGDIEVQWLEGATWDKVQDLLLSQTWHVLHFVGHGEFDVETEQGTLLLESADGHAHRVDAERFVDLLREASPMPRLVVLNACSGGRAGRDDLFSGTAAVLVRGGVTAVAAMQFEISDDGAIAFARGFYTALAQGRGVSQAVRSGRVAIMGSGARTLEWITPVLYLRGRTDQIFARTTAATVPVEQQVPPEDEVLEPDGAEEPLPVVPQPVPVSPPPADGRERPVEEPPVPWWRRPERVGPVAAVALVAALGIGVPLLNVEDGTEPSTSTAASSAAPTPTPTPSPTGPVLSPLVWIGPSAPDAEQQAALSEIRTAFADTGECAPGGTADPRNVLPTGPVNVVCSYPEGPTVVFSRFSTRGEVEDFFAERLAGRGLTGGRGTLGTDVPWQVALPSPREGQAYGTVNSNVKFDPVRAEIGWVPAGTRTYAYAFTPGDAFEGLFSWWVPLFTSA